MFLGASLPGQGSFCLRHYVLGCKSDWAGQFCFVVVVVVS